MSSYANICAHCVIAPYGELGTPLTQYGAYPDPQRFFRGLEFSPTPGIALDLWLEVDRPFRSGLHERLVCANALLHRVPASIIPFPPFVLPDPMLQWLWLLVNLDKQHGPDLSTSGLIYRDPIYPVVIDLAWVRENVAAGKVSIPLWEYHVEAGLYTGGKFPSGRCGPHFSRWISDVPAFSQRVLDWLTIRTAEIPGHDPLLVKDLERAAEGFFNIPMEEARPTPKKGGTAQVTDTGRKANECGNPAEVLLAECRSAFEWDVDLLLTPSPGLTYPDHYAAVIADLWEKAWTLGGVDKPPPRMPTPVSEIQAREAIGTLVQWIKSTFPPARPAKPDEASGSAKIESDVKVGLDEHIDAPLHSEFDYRFERIGNVWHLQFGDEKTQIADTLDGLLIIAHLLQKKHTGIPALELEGHDETRIPRSQTDAPALDEIAIREMKHELLEIEKAMKEVEGFQDQTEYRNHEHRKGAIEHQLRSDTGFGGKGRRLSGGNEASKAADRVRKAIKAVRDQLRKPIHNMSNLSNHLGEIKKDGGQFAYRPSTPEPTWKISF